MGKKIQPVVVKHVLTKTYLQKPEQDEYRPTKQPSETGPGLGMFGLAKSPSISTQQRSGTFRDPNMQMRRPEPVGGYRQMPSAIYQQVPPLPSVMPPTHVSNGQPSFGNANAGFGLPPGPAQTAAQAQLAAGIGSGLAQLQQQ